MEEILVEKSISETKAKSQEPEENLLTVSQGKARRSSKKKQENQELVVSPSRFPILTEKGDGVNTKEQDVNKEKNEEETEKETVEEGEIEQEKVDIG